MTGLQLPNARQAGTGFMPPRMRLPSRRHWHIEFDADGVPLVWDGLAADESDAITRARRALDYCHGIESARVAVCFEAA